MRAGPPFLADWEAFARTCVPADRPIDITAKRDHAALRASVIRLWTQFTVAIDQALAESVARFSQDVEQATETFLAILAHDRHHPPAPRRGVHRGRLAATVPGPDFCFTTPRP
jgi:hypothetical protein